MRSPSCAPSSAPPIRPRPPPGTIRKLYAESKGRNAIHASDSQENADREVGFFFPEGELAGLWALKSSVSGLLQVLVPA